MALRVLTWNLMHGRSVPAAGRDLLDDFASTLAGWEWDVALLQEVPPWWPDPLAARCGASARRVLTSRNFGLPLRRAIAVRRPDLIKSNGGGANAILVRRATILDHRTLRLCRLPERRWLHAVRTPAGWFGNVHLSVGDAAAARAQAAVAARTVLRWAGPAGPAVLGGDFNVRELGLDGLTAIAGADVDHVFAAGLGPTHPGDDAAAVLDAGRLSDHAPLLAQAM